MSPKNKWAIRTNSFRWSTFISNRGRPTIAICAKRAYPSIQMWVMECSIWPEKMAKNLYDILLSLRVNNLYMPGRTISNRLYMGRHQRMTHYFVRSIGLSCEVGRDSNYSKLY